MMAEELIRMGSNVEATNTSVLEALFDAYFEGKGSDAPAVDAAYRTFSHTLLDVDPFQIDEIMSASAVLCMECERAGFIAGIKARMRLCQELNDCDAECVLISADDYHRLLDEANNSRLLAMAKQRMEKITSDSFVSADALYEELGITQEDLLESGEIDIE